eukprot:TRINITY_DN61315_c0_g1_i1.p1 TRINITY_DN61315_c0_g1~~TRINITY_DN61315_c0_g1_i1.p1  ORF type:complete len:676 (+),score=-3.88 TRINITY_DN61315_c0_g1_i1:115-2142(+)
MTRVVPVDESPSPGETPSTEKTENVPSPCGSPSPSIPPLKPGSGSPGSPTTISLTSPQSPQPPPPHSPTTSPPPHELGSPESQPQPQLLETGQTPPSGVAQSPSQLSSDVVTDTTLRVPPPAYGHSASRSFDNCITEHESDYPPLSEHELQQQQYYYAHGYYPPPQRGPSAAHGAWYSQGSNGRAWQYTAPEHLQTGTVPTIRELPAGITIENEETVSARTTVSTSQLPRNMLLNGARVVFWCFSMVLLAELCALPFQVLFEWAFRRPVVGGPEDSELLRLQGTHFLRPRFGKFVFHVAFPMFTTLGPIVAYWVPFIWAPFRRRHMSSYNKAKWITVIAFVIGVGLHLGLLFGTNPALYQLISPMLAVSISFVYSLTVTAVIGLGLASVITETQPSQVVRTSTRRSILGRLITCCVIAYVFWTAIWIVAARLFQVFSSSTQRILLRTFGIAPLVAMFGGVTKFLLTRVPVLYSLVDIRWALWATSTLAYSVSRLFLIAEPISDIAWSIILLAILDGLWKFSSYYRTLWVSHYWMKSKLTEERLDKWRLRLTLYLTSDYLSELAAIFIASMFGIYTAINAKDNTTIRQVVTSAGVQLVIELVSFWLTTLSLLWFDHLPYATFRDILNWQTVKQDFAFWVVCCCFVSGAALPASFLRDFVPAVPLPDEVRHNLPPRW